MSFLNMNCLCCMVTLSKCPLILINPQNSRFGSEIFRNTAETVLPILLIPIKEDSGISSLFPSDRNTSKGQLLSFHSELVASPLTWDKMCTQVHEDLQTCLENTAVGAHKGIRMKHWTGLFFLENFQRGTCSWHYRDKEESSQDTFYFHTSSLVCWVACHYVYVILTVFLMTH